MFDFLHEILATIRRNKMRTLLTGFAVAWGIFLLIVLLGAGNGLQDAALEALSSRAAGSVRISPGRTSMPYGGYQTGRRIRFDDRDLELVLRTIPGVTHLSPICRGPSGTFSYGEQNGSWSMDGVGPAWQNVFLSLKVPEGQGRFINEIDMAQRRKVVVIGPDTRQVLFGEEDPIGKQILIGTTPFLVVGVYEDTDNRQTAFIPFSTAQLLYTGGYGVNRIDFILDGDELNSRAEIDAFSASVRRVFAATHRFDPDDRSAIRINTSASEALSMRRVFDAIQIFIWIIGIASMMAGIVGVGNIMLITVKERTREIGIRKAIGATPGSILKLIIFEAVFIMTAAGYAGILLGTAVIELVAFIMAKASEANAEAESTVIAFGGGGLSFEPSIDLSIVLSATVFLIACGTVAGLIPALRATRVRPIEAMRTE